MGANGRSNGALRALAREVDSRFAKMERQVSLLQREMKATRKSVRDLFRYVVYLETEFQEHRKDRTLHRHP